MPTIKITASNTSDGTLTLDDAGNTTTSKGSTVIWQIAAGSGVAEILNIYADSGSTDVFSPDPAPVGASTNWSGRVNPNLTVPAVEDYTIEWKDNSGNSHTYDPRISVNQ